MPEERGLYKNMTVGDQILYFGALKGMKKQDALSQAKYWFDRLEIDQWWNKNSLNFLKGINRNSVCGNRFGYQPKLLILDRAFFWI